MSKKKLPMSKNMKVTISIFFGLPATCYAVGWWIKALKFISMISAKISHITGYM